MGSPTTRQPFQFPRLQGASLVGGHEPSTPLVKERPDAGKLLSQLDNITVHVEMAYYFHSHLIFLFIDDVLQTELDNKTTPIRIIDYRS
jgi:hypothetical protein